MIAIEFEDATPEKSSRKERDHLLVTEILLAAGVPLIKAHVRDIGQIENLAQRLSVAWQRRLETLAASPPLPGSLLPSPEPPTESLAVTTRLPSPTRLPVTQLLPE